MVYIPPRDNHMNKLHRESPKAQCTYFYQHLFPHRIFYDFPGGWGKKYFILKEDGWISKHNAFKQHP